MTIYILFNPTGTIVRSTSSLDDATIWEATRGTYMEVYHEGCHCDVRDLGTYKDDDDVWICNGFGEELYCIDKDGKINGVDIDSINLTKDFRNEVLQTKKMEGNHALH